MQLSTYCFLVVKYSELCDLATEAAQNDGRLARRPFLNSRQEILAHQILLSHIIQLTKEYSASIEVGTAQILTDSLVEATFSNFCKQFGELNSIVLPQSLL